MREPAVETSSPFFPVPPNSVIFKVNNSSLFKVNSKKIHRAMFSSCYGFFISNFEHISHIFPGF